MTIHWHQWKHGVRFGRNEAGNVVIEKLDGGLAPRRIERAVQIEGKMQVVVEERPNEAQVTMRMEILASEWDSIVGFLSARKKVF